METFGHDCIQHMYVIKTTNVLVMLTKMDIAM